MIVQERVKTEVLNKPDILCDRCGKSATNHPDCGPQFATFSTSWGYGSGRDMTAQEAHLCEKCWSEFVPVAKKFGIRIRETRETAAGNVVMWVHYNGYKEVAETAKAVEVELIHREIVKLAKTYTEHAAAAAGMSIPDFRQFLETSNPDRYLTLTIAQIFGVDFEPIHKRMTKQFKQYLEPK